MKGRPAESITGATAIGMLMAIILGVNDEDTMTAMIGALGLAPAAVTLIVSHGGLRGVVRIFWRGGRHD